MDNDPLPLEERDSEGKTNKGKQSQYFVEVVSSLSGKFISIWQQILFIFRKSTSLVIKSRALLPHVGILLFAFIAGITNWNSAKAISEMNLFTTTDPATSSAIVGAVIDQYTPQIKDNDILIIDQSVALADGFISNAQPVETQITAQAVPKDTTLPNQSKTITYKVDSGDTLSSIGWKYGVKLASIKYVNDMSDVDKIKPGQSLKIPPVGFEVSASKIAAKDKKLAVANRTTVTRDSSATRNGSSTKLTSNILAGTKYPRGWCTSYVSARRPDIPGSLGNAGGWYRNARAAGMATGQTPAVGAVIVTTQSYYGHVGIVESVNGNTITVSDMNGFAGFNHVGYGTFNIEDGRIKGYIY